MSVAVTSFTRSTARGKLDGLLAGEKGGIMSTDQIFTAAMVQIAHRAAA